MLSEQLEMKKPSSVGVVGERGATAAQKENEQIPKAFPAAEQRFAAAVARSSAHMKLLNASVVGENRTAAMHGGHRRAGLSRADVFSLTLVCSSSTHSLFQNLSWKTDSLLRVLTSLPVVKTKD